MIEHGVFRKESHDDTVERLGNLVNKRRLSGEIGIAISRGSVILGRRENTRNHVNLGHGAWFWNAQNGKPIRGDFL